MKPKHNKFKPKAMRFALLHEKFKIKVQLSTEAIQSDVQKLVDVMLQRIET